jgi:hypothetical protein
MRVYLLFIILLFPQLLIASELTDLQDANFLLRSELQLAKGAKLYMLIDLPGEAILFKAGGVVVNRLPIDDNHVVGTLLTQVVRTLSAKKAEKQPKRPEVKIVTEAEMAAAPIPAPGVDTLVALEIDDMPETYQLVLDDGLVMVVRSKLPGLKNRAARFWQDSVESAQRIYYALVRRFKGGEVSEKRIVIYLSGPDARQFYWSFDEGMACLLRVN